MTRRTLAYFVALGSVILGAASSARGQMQDAFVEPQISHDLQLFAPVDFDFNGNPVDNDCGWFFNYNRVSWAISGERAVIGDKGRTVQAEAIVRVHPLDDIPDPAVEGFSIPTPYTIINGIQDGGPDANFGWGDRYELGYFRGGNGWMVGILDGPISVTNKVYGFPELSIPNNLPIQQTFPGPGFGDPNVDTTDLQIFGAVTAGQGDITTTQSGFGSVHVNFETPDGYLLGWRDYWETPDPQTNVGAPVTGGPSYVITQITRADGLVTNITLFRGADGVIDNMDDDLIAGFGVIVADDGTGNLVPVATFIDYDDLHMFNIRFDRLTSRNTTETQGFELMRTHELDNSYLPVKEQRNRFAIGYGARYLRIRDNFYWEGLGDVFGRSYAGTGAENNLVGPQIQAKWTNQRGRFSFDLDGRFVAAYNVQNLDQEGGIGENLNPGGLNSPLFAQPTYFHYGKQENFFSPLAEMRIEGRYQITSSFALKLGYTAMFTDNITRASQIVRYRLPDMGFREGEIGKQNIFINGADFGVEAVF